jgi:tetrahydromethanopterin S-methyltransferase subunit H
MFSFTQNQKIVEISKTKIGGQPGNFPTVLFSGFFFKGEPDFLKAKNHVKKMYQLSDKTGNPVIPDFFIKKEENLEKIIEFISNEIPKEKPFSVDIIEPDLKIKTLEILFKKNLLKRTIYNSIHIGTTSEERQTLRKCTPEMAIVVAFNPKDKSPDGKIEVLENGANLLDIGLLKLTKQVGIKKILIDTAAMAPGDNSGAAISAIPVIKEEYGLPVGCAIHNVVEKSKWLNDFEDARRIVDAASNINIPLFGGDFAIYGPVENSEIVFPIISWQDILVSEYTENYFGITPDINHPRRKLLK